MAQHEPIPDELDRLASLAVDAALAVHRGLGPGLLESVYEICLCRELSKRGVNFQRQLALPIFYDGVRLDAGLRLDLLVDDRLIVELKAVDELHPLHEAQVLTYLKLTEKRLALLINFNVVRIKDGIQRIVR